GSRGASQRGAFVSEVVCGRREMERGRGRQDVLLLALDAGGDWQRYVLATGVPQVLRRLRGARARAGQFNPLQSTGPSRQRRGRDQWSRRSGALSGVPALWGRPPERGQLHARAPV